ncbi:MAG: FAD-dependent oxidoreductase [Candidatus Methanoperedens sp.]|nr:FAD-binding protein [Candidatus Methanoperedens sp.]MCZ7395738.1 FAD-binding protein [Candidatus Methanoperedens sp.]
MAPIFHPVLVIGGGLAGLRAALEAKKYCDVAVLSMVYPVRSHSCAAQGGINASLGNAPEGKDDTWEKHAYDTVKGSDFLADQDAVEILTKEARERVYEMEHWGTPFSRTAEGKIAQRPFGGAEFPRTCYAEDTTGHALLHTMNERAVKNDIKVYPERFVVSLVVLDKKVAGVIALNRLSGKLEAYAAHSVVLATGGAGRIYAETTNSLIMSGYGIYLAFRAGAALKDMEFMQFHPTSLFQINILLTEGCRGEGGYLLNSKGERFMAWCAPKALELAPRDIVARAIATEIMEGRGASNKYVYLDLRHLGEKKIDERLPGIRKLCQSFIGLDPVRDLIPVEPAQHYTMGGIDCNVNGETEIEGLYAAGECACVSVHGANRLGGNSLLETLVFGKRVGESAAAFAAREQELSQSALDAIEREYEKVGERIKGRDGKEKIAAIRNDLGKLMTKKVGIFRREDLLKEALDEISTLSERFRHVHVSSGTVYNLDLLHALDLDAMLALAGIIAKGAFLRKESRGSHFRTDYPERDDAHFLKHTIARSTPDGVTIEYKDVAITKFKPEKRVY